MKCRHCQSDQCFEVIDLGHAPPSNAYLSPAQLARPEIWYPLRVMVCSECWLMQTVDVTDYSQLFDADYAYFSSYSASWLAHAKNLVTHLITRFHLTPEQLVVEVAANDGYLLQYVKDAGIRCLGIEPTLSTAIAAREKGLEIETCFFGTQTADQLSQKGCQADCMIANNVLAHVPDINDFVGGFTRLLKPTGVITFEFPHVLALLQHHQFDTIYHEHFSYLSLLSVTRILQQQGLMVFDVEQLTTHGGSLRLYVQHQQTGPHATNPQVNALLDLEREAGLAYPATYQALNQQAIEAKHALLAFLLTQKQAGNTVVAYGAAAKGNTFLNYAGIRPDLLEAVVDRNPHKQGKYLPGSRIPIVDETYLRERQPRYILILPWNLTTEIIEQLSYARQWGAQFVRAIPALEIL
ncbi:class I SAM-dependent methyltransferase [Parvibium lacunae]|uniref:Methyltransferase domain-containing protein n=1 Tax=Parvibium lacunae TaxID=1888893 RepID=A0A368L3P2_9BURK|nr:class I SAM-dependent methyltransferase [Parvibium lacunae]RCS58216.1 methyltransferase domain-containing protein [Parvibium lacunae]